MTQPVVVLFYETLMPGSALVNRLTDLGYRVHPVHQVAEVFSLVQRDPPMLLLADLDVRDDDFSRVIREVRGNRETQHVAILGISRETQRKKAKAAIDAGANLVAADTEILDQLPHLLDHVLAVE